MATPYPDGPDEHSVHGPTESSPFEDFPPLSDSKKRSDAQESQLLAQQPSYRRAVDAETQKSSRSGLSRTISTNSTGSGRLGEGDRSSSKSLTCRVPSTEEHETGLHPAFNFKEKNRAAQRRYRFRQKEKLQISEDKVAQLTQQLQSVQLEQQTLTERNVMLERLLSMQQAVATQTPDATGGHSAIEVQKDAWWLDSEMKDFMENAFSLEGELVFTVRADAPLRLTQNQVAALSDDEFDSLWKEYVNAYAVLLIEARGNPDTAPGRRLARLIHEGGQMKASLLISAPDRMHHKLARSRAGSNSEVWRSIILTSRLSDEQKGAIVALRGLYLRNLGLLSRCRQELTAVLQAELPMSGGALGGPTLASNTYSRTLTTMDSLRDTLRDEHTCLLQFILTVVRRVLTPMQTAHIHVTCHPSHVDILSIAETLAQQAGEPKSCVVMNAASQEPRGTQLVPIDRALPRTMRAYTRPGVDLLSLYPHLSPQLQSPLQPLDCQQHVSPSLEGSSSLE